MSRIIMSPAAPLPTIAASCGVADPQYSCCTGGRGGGGGVCGTGRKMHCDHGGIRVRASQARRLVLHH